VRGVLSYIYRQDGVKDREFAANFVHPVVLNRRITNPMPSTLVYGRGAQIFILFGESDPTPEF
jgi:hypothetical protein